MIGWCGRKVNGHTNPYVDHSLCLIFQFLFKTIEYFKGNRSLVKGT